MNRENTDLLVTIQCLTYNHEPYIRKCLEGFIMQKTNFRFEAIVHDDASTDGTAEIVREYSEKYPGIIRAFFETENQYSKHNGVIGKIIRENTHGKYIAMCEGDDFWIDPLKLQKQVDFLESHPDYGLVHTYFNYVDVQGNIIPPPTDFYKNLRGRIFDGYIWGYYLVNPGFILTCTSMYRRSLYQLEEKTFLDHGLFMMIARQSKTYCLREVTAAYRRNPAGAMCTASTYYSNLCQRAILYQLYYFFLGASCCDYYKINRRVAGEIEIAYTYSVLKYYKALQKEDWRILIGIACKHFCLLLKMPSCLVRIMVKNKKKKQRIM